MKTRFYHYIIPIYIHDLDGSRRLWFTVSFSSKAKADLWCAGFRNAMLPNTFIGDARVRYCSYKPEF